MVVVPLAAGIVILLLAANIVILIVVLRRTRQRKGPYRGLFTTVDTAIRRETDKVFGALHASVPDGRAPGHWLLAEASDEHTGLICGIAARPGPARLRIKKAVHERVKKADIRLEDTMRAWLAVNRAILFQNAVDDIRERRQLRALRRLASPISRRFRMQQYLGNRLAVDPELARSFPSAQTLTMTRQSHSSIKIHSVHPPPSIRSILTKAIDGPILVRRRNRTNRPLHWGIIAPPFSGACLAVVQAFPVEFLDLAFRQQVQAHIHQFRDNIV